jgi:hypothetical protein
MNNAELLTRCCIAFTERYERCGPLDDWVRECVAEVLLHLAAELVVLSQRDQQLTVHQLSRLLSETNS